MSVSLGVERIIQNDRLRTEREAGLDWPPHEFRIGPRQISFVFLLCFFMGVSLAKHTLASPSR